MNPITQAIGTIRGIYEKVIGVLTPNFAAGNILTEMMIYFGIISLLVVTLRLFNLVGKNVIDEQGLKLSLIPKLIRELSYKMLLVPFVVFASAIPMFIREITPGAFAPTAAVSDKVAQLGDSLINSLQVAMAQFDGGRIQASLDAARGLSLSGDGQPVQWANEEDQKAFRALAADHSRAQENLRKAVEAERSAEQTLANTQGTATGQTKAMKRNLQDARTQRQKATESFQKVHEAVMAQVRDATQKMRVAKLPAEVNKAKMQSLAYGAAATGSKLIAVAMPGAGPMGWVAGKFAKWKSESAGERAVNLQAGKADPLDDRSSLGRVFDFLTHLGFYASLLPALLGIIAGAVLCLKEALGLLQYGAKLEVLRNVGLGIASIFAPLFMLCFLWEKTEQFGWKFLSFLLSMFFGYFAVSYVAGIVGNSGMAFMKAQLETLIVFPITTFNMEGSWDLFFASLAIGLKGLGVGMVTAFCIDIIKSALQLGQGFFNGTFSAS